MIKWGIIGTGSIANLMATDFQYVKEGELLGVVGTSLSKAQVFAEKYQIPRTYETVEALLADQEIEAVYIATPHNTHRELAIQVAKAGKAILCEKPMGVNLADEEAMILAAVENDVLLMEAFWTLYLPIMKTVFEWISEGRIGELKHIQANFSFSNKQGPEGRLVNPKLAGGALLDVGVYPITLAYAIAQLVDSGEIVSSNIFTTMTETGVDGNSSIQVLFESGLVANLSCGIEMDGDVRLALFGNKGRIEVPFFSRGEKALLYNGESIEEVTRDLAIIGYAYEVDAFCQLMKEGAKESKVVSHQQSKTIIKFIDELRETIGLKYPFE